MILALVLALAAIPAPSAPSSAPPPWCAGALSLSSRAPESADDGASGASATDVSAAFDALALALPKDAPVVARARELASEDVVQATSLLRFAVTEACAPAMASAEELAARTAELMKDERFTGVRKGDGAFDRVLHKIWLAIVSLLESQGMQQYAGSARLIYLSLLGVVALLVAVFVGRALARQRRADASAKAPSDVVIEAKRRKAYAALRAEATRLLTAGDARAALRAGDAALLARVGELDDAQAWGAVTPARTHREIVARLPAPVGDVVRAPFASFDALFFGRPSIAVDDARAFLGEVDAAHGRLDARSPVAQGRS